MTPGFLSTLSLRRATSNKNVVAGKTTNFYPRSPCGERHRGRAVGDRGPHFYPRSPCGERHIAGGHQKQHGVLFLSTLSLRRATPSAILGIPNQVDFYPRSPCGERQWARACRYPVSHISIHALLAESDTGAKSHDPGKILFLSTLSLRRATTYPSQWRTLARDFYPRSPCGERPIKFFLSHQNKTISIHALLAESDFPISAHCFDGGISIHALLAESDPRACPVLSPRRYFYPRSPCGERLTADTVTPDKLAISIHALLAESD